MKITSQTGFTLMELLILAAVAGLVISIAVVILNSIRLKNSTIVSLRDSRRLQDLTALRDGLDLYESAAGGYPDTSKWHSGGVISCGANDIIQVPYDPGTGEPYTYKAEGRETNSHSCGDKIWSGYGVTFHTEAETFLGPSGTYCLTFDRGFVAGGCT